MGKEKKLVLSESPINLSEEDKETVNLLPDEFFELDFSAELKGNGLSGNGISGNGISGNGMSGNGLSGNGLL